MTQARGLLDTSVFIENESGRELDMTRMPDEVATSVVTLAELQVGVLAAGRGLPVVTQDGDFDPLDGVAGLAVVKV